MFSYIVLDENNIADRIYVSDTESIDPKYIPATDMSDLYLGQYYDTEKRRFFTLETMTFLFSKFIKENISPILIGQTYDATIPANSPNANIDVAATVGSQGDYIHTVEIMSAADNTGQEVGVVGTLNVAEKRLYLARNGVGNANPITVVYRINKQTI